MRATRVSLDYAHHRHSFCLYLFCSTLPVLFISRNIALSELVQFLTWIRILSQNILINQSNNTEHKFGGLEALPLHSLMHSFPTTHMHTHTHTSFPTQARSVVQAYSQPLSTSQHMS